MAAIGLIVHHGRPAAVAAAGELSGWLAASGHTVRLPCGEGDAPGLRDTGAADTPPHPPPTREEDDAPGRNEAGGNNTGCGHPTPTCEEDDAPGLGGTASTARFADGLDLVVTLGGDGSILRAVELVGEAGVPILGVNFGRMGYIAEVAPEEARGAISRVLDGGHRIEERMLLEVELSPSGPPGAAPEHSPGAAPARRRCVALNDAVLERHGAANALRLAVAIDDEPFTTYAADGLIVATPTGSTAYALSARGPIIDPAHRALLLTPVSPHMLFDRSLVVSAHSLLSLEVRDDRGALLSVDGRRVAHLGEHDVVTCTASPAPARLVTFGARRFHQVLKAKFGLNDR